MTNHARYRYIYCTVFFLADVYVGPSPAELSPADIAFRILPIAHQYDTQLMLELCVKAFERSHPIEPGLITNGKHDGLRPEARHEPISSCRGDYTVDDAFSTIMQWLHSRIPATR